MKTKTAHILKSTWIATATALLGVYAVFAAEPIRLRSGTVDPAVTAVRGGAIRATSVDANGRGVYIIQHDGVTPPEWKEALEKTGAKILRYIPENAYIVSADATAAAKLQSSVEHSYFDVYRPQYKMADAAATVMMQARSSMSARLASSGGVVAEPAAAAAVGDFAVILFEAEKLSEISARIQALDGCVVLASDGAVLQVSLTQAALSLVASWAEVEWVEPYAESKSQNNVAVDAARMNVRVAWPSGSSGLGLTGKGQVVAVADTGLDTGNLSTVHEDVRGRISRTYALGRTGDWSDTDGHGTHVVGSVLGNGAKSSGSIKGSAYEATLIFQSTLNSSGGLSIPRDLNTLFNQAYVVESGKPGARIHSNSWGAGRNNGTWILGYYNNSSQAIDQFCFEHPDMLLLFAAGNDAEDGDGDGVADEDSLSAQASAKNNLVVGAAENDRTSGGYSTYKWGQAWPSDYPANPIYGDYISRPYTGGYQGMAAFSSRGPCDDGRIKPDIVAPGTDVVSLHSTLGDWGWGKYNSFYAYMGGTSMATPLVAGAAVLVRQWLVENQGIANPDGATVKAVLLAGAKSLTPGQYGTGATREIPASYPNNVEGWGQANVGNAVANTKGVVVYDGRIIGHRETQTFKVRATSGSALAIVMAYADAPASLSSSKQLVNDLDLTVTTPSGTTLYPNSRTSADRLNNVEGVRIASAAAGDYTITVSAYAINTAMSTSWTGGKANATRYSLVVNGATETPTVQIPDAPQLRVDTWGQSLANTSYINMTWANVAGAASYDIYRSTSTTRPSTPIARNVTSPYRDYAASSGLAPGVRYYYWVSAANSAGTSYSASDWGNIAVSLALGTEALSFRASGGTMNVSVTANTAWSRVAEGGWLSTSAPNGMSGNGTVAVTATANTGEARSGKVKIVAGSGTSYPVTKTITVTQEEKEFVEFVVVNNVLVGYNGSGGSVNIPQTEQTTGQQILEIGDEVFKNNVAVTSVSIPSSVSKIGKYAFYGCANLTSVSFGGKVKEIGNWSFQNTGLTVLSLPDSVETIGTAAFFGCESLGSVNLGKVKKIMYGAFYGCKALRSISIPNSVTDMDAGSTFYYCGALSSVSFGSGLRTIPQNCFAFCTALDDVTVPPTVTNIDFRAFFACTNLASVTLQDGVKALGNNAFDECTALAEIMVPASVKSIGNYAFVKCSALTNVTYLGNAPSVEPGIYRSSNQALVSYVSRDSTGWDGVSGSRILPSAFPSNGGSDARAIVRDMGPPPAVPVLSIATRGENADESTITVAWVAAAGTQTYNIYRSTSETRPNVPLARNVASPYVDTKSAGGLQPGVRYWYWVEAVNEAGTAFSEPEWGNIAAEPEIEPPDTPFIIAIGGNEYGVSLEWEAAVGADTYSVYRSADAGQTGELIAEGLVALDYFDMTAEPGIDYAYRVAAVNGAGETVGSSAAEYRRVALSVSRATLSLAADGRAVSLTLEANTDWLATVSEGWLSVTPASGVVDASLSVSAEENTVTASRNGIVTFVAGAGTAHPEARSVAVTQAAAVRQPETGAGLVDNLVVRRFWPDAEEGTLDCFFSVALAQGVSSLPLEVAVIDADYNVDMTDECYIYDVSDPDDPVDFENGGAYGVGNYRFKVQYYGYGGTKALQMCFRLGDGEWEVAPPVRVAFGDGLLATGTESWWNGAVGGETNTTLLANGIYDYGFAAVPATGDSLPYQFIQVYNSDGMAVEEGRLPSNTVWSADAVHVLRGDVVVPSGVTLTVCNGAYVRRFDSSCIYVEDGGTIRLQGVTFQNFTLGEEAPDMPGAYAVSAEEVVEFEDGVGNVGGEITGFDYDSDFGFTYSYTLDEIVERLPAPPAGAVPGCAFGGWIWRDGDYSKHIVDPQQMMEEGAFETEGLPFTLNVDAQWIPAMPTNVCAHVRGAGIPDGDVGRQVKIEWTPVLSAMVTGYEVVFFRDGEEPAEMDWDYSAEAAYTCYDMPSQWGIFGGETVHCRVRAITDAEKGEAVEFAFALPLMLNLRRESGVVSEYGGGEDVYLENNVNVKWRAESDASWIHVTTDFTEDEIRTYFSYEVGSTDQPRQRTGRIRVIGGGAVRSYTVVQGGIPELETKVATPVVLPADGAAFNSDTCPVTIECDTAGASIFYTLDGSVPGRSSTRYTTGFNITDTTTVKAMAVADGKEDSDVVESTITKAAPLTLVNALDLASGMAVTTTGTSLWMPELDGTAVGGSSARSGRVGVGDTTAMSLAVTGSGTLSFRWKSDCLHDVSGGYSLDCGAVSIDGTVVRRIDGVTGGWQTVSVEVSGSGTHTVQWNYTKNAREEYIVVGEDCIWVDYVVWTPGGVVDPNVTIDLGGGASITIPKSWFEQYPTLLARYGNDYVAMALAPSGKSDRRGNPLYIWQDYVAGTNPTDPTSVFKVAAFKYEDGKITITWTPDLNENGTKSVRRYKVYGAESVGQVQWDLIETDRPAAKYKVFAVGVEMP